MRGIWIAALSLACSAPVETTDPERESEQRRESVEVDAGGPEVAPYLCFRIDDAAGVTDYLPTVRSALSLAAHRWEWPVLIHDDCESVVTVESLDADDIDPAAQTTAWEVAPGEYLSGAYVGGATKIALDLEHLQSGKLTDFGQCLDGESFFLLVRVLTHEIGHALGVEHSDNEGAVMARQAVECEDAWPSADELSAASRSAR